MLRAAGRLSLVVLLGACASTTSPTTSASTGTTSTSSSTSTSLPGPPCLEGEAPFTSEASVVAFGASAGTGDATALGAIRWEPYAGCERLVIDFLTADGAPATAVGPGSVRLLPTSGVVRIELPAEIDDTAVAQVALDGDLAGDVFVVRDADRSLFADVHLSSPDEIRMRAFSLEAPARVVVDLAPGSRAGVVLAPPIADGPVVLLTPASGPAEYPFTVSGYARTFEANVLVRLQQDDVIGFETNTTAADWTETWGWFSVAVASGPNGSVGLFVGELSPQDGAEDGVRVTLDLP